MGNENSSASGSAAANGSTAPSVEDIALETTTAAIGFEPELLVPGNERADVTEAPAVACGESSATSAAVGTASVPEIRQRRFAPQDEKYLTDRAVDLDIAWQQRVRSGTEAEVRMHLRRSDVVGGGLCIWYPQQEPTYLRVQLHDRGAANNYAKTLALKGFSPPPYIPTTVTTSVDDPLYIVEAPMKALALERFPVHDRPRWRERRLLREGRTASSGSAPLVSQARPPSHDCVRRRPRQQRSRRDG